MGKGLNSGQGLKVVKLTIRRRREWLSSLSPVHSLTPDHCSWVLYKMPPKLLPPAELLIEALTLDTLDICESTYNQMAACGRCLDSSCARTLSLLQWQAWHLTLNLLGFHLWHLNPHQMRWDKWSWGHQIGQTQRGKGALDLLEVWWHCQVQWLKSERRVRLRWTRLTYMHGRQCTLHFIHLDGLPKGNNPVPMCPNDLGLLWDLNRDLKEIPKVLGLLSLNNSGVVGPKDLGKVNCKPLDNVEPLVWREVWASRWKEDLPDHIGGISCPVLKEVEALLDLWLKPSTKDCWGSLPGEQVFID